MEPARSVQRRAAALRTSRQGSVNGAGSRGATSRSSTGTREEGRSDWLTKRWNSRSFDPTSSLRTQTQAIAAAKDATITIPIVMVIVVDPVGAGLVVSLARPAGNITGLTFDVSEELWGKRLELLREAAPGGARVV